MILVVTHIDKITGISCTQAPCKNGPVLPKITGLKALWSRTSKYPTNVPEIICSVPPGDYADISGVLEVLSDDAEPVIFAEELEARRVKEFQINAEPIRQTRNVLLTQSDIYVLPDYPISPEKRLEWVAYRQALRDISTQDTFPNSVFWPVPPLKE